MGNPDRELVVALVTFPDEVSATQAARALLEERLVACVNVLPGARSLYRWQGEVCDDGEVLTLLKSTTDRLAELEARLVALHPYDVPEFVVLAPSRVEERYRAWLLGEVDARSAPGAAPGAAPSAAPPSPRAGDRR